MGISSATSATKFRDVNSHRVKTLAELDCTELSGIPADDEGAAVSIANEATFGLSAFTMPSKAKLA